MALDTFKCNYLASLHFKGLTGSLCDVKCTFCVHVCFDLDFVNNRLLWIDSRLATLNAYMLTTSRREVLHAFLEYPRHPAGLTVFEVYTRCQFTLQS